MSKVTQIKKPAPKPAKDSKTLVKSKHSQELFFAVVGPAGAGGSQAIKALKRVCEAQGYICEWIKASKLIETWAVSSRRAVPSSTKKTLESVIAFQDLGDEMRKTDAAEIAKSAMREIARLRAHSTGQSYEPGQVISPDERKRVYLIDSIRHPAEIYLLRRTYGNSFALIGVVCEEDERKHRLMGKYFTTPERNNPSAGSSVDEFMRRDSDDPEKSMVNMLVKHSLRRIILSTIPLRIQPTRFSCLTVSLVDWSA